MDAAGQTESRHTRSIEWVAAVDQNRWRADKPQLFGGLRRLDAFEARLDVSKTCSDRTSRTRSYVAREFGQPSKYRNVTLGLRVRASSMPRVQDCGGNVGTPTGTS
jgi:hypothetical protein